jgi:hypothetical protein
MLPVSAEIRPDLTRPVAGRRYAVKITTTLYTIKHNVPSPTPAERLARYVSLDKVYAKRADQEFHDDLASRMEEAR